MQARPVAAQVDDVDWPAAAFYLWLPTAGSDTMFARQLYIEKNVTVLPGSFLARDSAGVNPGKNRVRVALVSTVEECAESARRIADFIKNIV